MAVAHAPRLHPRLLLSLLVLRYTEQLEQINKKVLEEDVGLLTRQLLRYGCNTFVLLLRQSSGCNLSSPPSLPLSLLPSAAPLFSISATPRCPSSLSSVLHAGAGDHAGALLRTGGGRQSLPPVHEEDGQACAARNEHTHAPVEGRFFYFRALLCCLCLCLGERVWHVACDTKN